MNVLLLTVDALRYDAAARMERWEAFTRAKGGGWRFFADHCGTAHCSDPNYVSMLTGFRPDAFSVFTQMGHEYKDPLPTLQVGLGQLLGYKCWAQGPMLVPGFYRRGFHQFVWCRCNEITSLDFRGTRDVVRELGEPWFGLVRLMDCHYPYHGAKDVPRMATGQPHGSRIARAYWRAVAHVDRWLVRFVQWVLDEYPDTAIIVTADHGESLGEHGVWDHLFSLYEVLVHVPAWAHLPGMEGYAACRALTQHVDVVPTVCDLLGLEQQGEGISWLPWLRGEGPEPDRDHVYLAGWGASMRDMWRHRGVRGHRWKYIANWHRLGYASHELYDLPEDPVENHNLVKSKPATAREQADLLARVAPSFPRPSSPLEPAFTDAEARAVERRLAALGYL